MSFTIYGGSLTINRALADGGGFEPPVPFGTHAFQACTINRSVTHPNNLPLPLTLTLSSSGDNRSRPRRTGTGKGRFLELQSPEQFVERQLNADIKLAEVRIFGAHRIEPHFVNDRLDLKCVSSKQRHAPFCVVETSRTGDQLFHFAGELAPDTGMAFH